MSIKKIFYKTAICKDHRGSDGFLTEPCILLPQNKNLNQDDEISSQKNIANLCHKMTLEINMIFILMMNIQKYFYNQVIELNFR